MANKTLNILGLQFQIVGETDSHTTGMQGCCNNANATFYIASNLRPDNRASTLLHEIIHAIDYKLELDLTEAQVKCLETGLYQVLTANGVSLAPLLADSAPKSK